MRMNKLVLITLLFVSSVNLLVSPSHATESGAPLSTEASTASSEPIAEIVEETSEAIEAGKPDSKDIPKEEIEGVVLENGEPVISVEKSQQLNLQWWETLLLDWINNKNPDYQPVINQVTDVFSGNLPIGNKINSTFSHSFNIKTPGIRRYIGYRPDGGFLNAGLDVWITGDSYTDIKSLVSRRSNFTSNVERAGDNSIISINRSLQVYRQGDYTLEVNPQYYLWKVEFYNRFNSSHYQTSYPSRYYYGNTKKIDGTFTMPDLSMEITNNKIPIIEMPLGGSATTVEEQIRNQIEVKIGGEAINKNNYFISYQNLRNDLVGENEFDYTLSWKSDPTIQVSGKAKANINWGSSVVFGSYDIYGNDRTSAAFTVHQAAQPTITATKGINDDNLQVHSSFPNKKYYGFDWFNTTASNELNVSEARKGSRSMEVNGDELKTDALKKWTTQTVNYGDVVRGYQLESGRNWLYENEQRKNYSDGNYSVYYEVTRSGFKPITLNKLSPEKQKINYGMTNSELDKEVNKYLNTEGYSDLAVTRFIKYPDTSKQGTAEGTIQVVETLSTGRKVTYDYTVPFQVDRMTVSPQPGTVDLGTESQKLNYASYVKDVRFNGQSLKAEDYIVSPQNSLATSWVGAKDLILRVSLKSDTTKFTEVTVPIEVRWGNSVVFGSYDLGEDGRTSAAFTLHRSSSDAMITASMGRHDDNEQIHSSFYGKKYYGFDWFDLKSSSLVDVSEEKSGTKSIAATGDERKREAIQKWTPQTVGYGDVVRAWQLEPFRNWLYEQEQKQSYNDGKTSVYYEVTKDGFQPLNITKLTVEKQTINYGMSKAELDKNLASYLSVETYDSLAAVKFISYPDTTKHGATTGSIQVVETLSSGKKISYVYMIPFQVDRVTADPKSASLDLGTMSQTLDYKKFVENVQFNGQKLNEDAYTVEAQNTLQVGTIGATKLSVQIRLKSDTSKAVTIDVPVTIKWGSSIVYGSYDIYGNGRTSAAFTLHASVTPFITASSGISDDNAMIHSSFINLKYYGFDWFDLSKANERTISEASRGDRSIESMGNELKSDALKKWQPQAVSYGDVVRAWQLETGKNWLYEEERRKTYNDEKNAVYYEVTAAGFKPLNLNKLAVETHEIVFDTKTDVMDKNISTYLDTKNYSNLEIDKFVAYPDTSRAGVSEGIIRVVETLANNKKVSYDYTILFKISDPITMIDVAIPEKILFGSLDVEGGEVISPTYKIENRSKKRLKTVLDSVEIARNQDSIKLLKPEDNDPIGKESAIRLNLVEEQSEISIPIVAGKIDQPLAILDSESQSHFQMKGQYFDDFKKNTSLELKLLYTFEVVSDSSG